LVVLYILGALLLLLVSLTFIRVGIYISFGQELRIKVKAGPVTRQILPKPDKPKEDRKQKKPKKAGEEGTAKKPGRKKLDLTFEDIRSAFPAVFESLKRGLRRTRKRMKIHPMTVSVIFGGEDPARVSEMYGWAGTVMWTVMPQLEQLIRIPDPRIHLDVDYTALKTRSEGEIGISLLVRDGIGIGWSFGIPLIKWYLSTRRSKKTAPKDNNSQDENKGE